MHANDLLRLREGDIFNSFKFLLCMWNPLMSKVGGQKVTGMLTLIAVYIHQYWISIIKIDPKKENWLEVKIVVPIA